jgi:hypothetical protein
MVTDTLFTIGVVTNPAIPAFLISLDIGIADNRGVRGHQPMDE